ncbi:hypothetical protein FRC12_011181, partial [Ceratobasidium sp. 428]
GQTCIIFDAIFNPELCTKAAKDAELRRALIETSLVRIEQDTGFKLSRTIGTPNIKSKGPIPPRTARIPAFWASRPSLVQEVGGPSTPTWAWTPTREGCRIAINVPDMSVKQNHFRHPELPISSLASSHPFFNSQARHSVPAPRDVTLYVPNSHTHSCLPPIISHAPVGSSHTRLHVPGTLMLYLLYTPIITSPNSLIGQRAPPPTKSLHETSTLDIEARRLIFTAGSRYHIDTPLLPAAGSKAAPDAKPVGGEKFLPTTVDPDSAVAEWSIKNKDITIVIKWASVAAREREREN